MYNVSLAEMTLLNKMYTSMSDNVFYEFAKSCGNSNFLGLREDRFRKHIVKSASYVQESCRDDFIHKKIYLDVICESKLSVHDLLGLKPIYFLW